MFTKFYEKCKKFIAENFKSILLLVVIFCLFYIELPFVIYAPGGAINLTDRIKLEGEAYEPDGKLSMAYVSMVKGSIPFLALSFVIPNWDIEKKSNVTYDNETLNDMMNRDKIYLQEAVDNATIVAYQKAGKSIEILNSTHHVVYLDEQSDTSLKLFDEIIKVDGKTFTTLDDFKIYVQTRKEEDILTFDVLRNKHKASASAKVYNTEDGLKVGISVVSTHEYKTDPKVEIKSKNSESGPSGGLMTALSIYDAITKSDLTHGKNIIGTGTISIDGTVGEIGGVKYKLLGAEKKKVDLFLCPMGNLEEALRVKDEEDLKIEIKGVATFEEALNFLLK